MNSDNAKLVARLRLDVKRLYSRAYPSATKNDAWEWRLRKVGKSEVSTWTLRDWMKAKSILMNRLGLGRKRSRPDHSTQEQLL